MCDVDTAIEAALLAVYQWDYRYWHDCLHQVYGSVCGMEMGKRCKLESHILLQEEVMAVRISEQRVRYETV